MSTITTIQSSDLISNSRADINNNFSALNNDKIETSYLDTDTTLAANSDSKIATQKAVKLYVDAGGTASNLERLLPVGAILPYIGSSAPSYFKLCDGSAISRTTYAALYAIIGTTYGTGDGSTTFNLPDLRNRIPLGSGTATKVATFASRSSNEITVTGLSNVANNEFQTGQAVVYHTTGSVITGLTNDATYYIVRVSNLVFSLASSLANAQNGTVISLSGDGTGTQTFTLTFTARSLGNTGGEENHAMSSTELFRHAHTNAPGTGSAAGGGSSAKTNDGTTDLTGGNAAMNIMQPFVVVNYIIKI
jgi:microcystin-dependent protein